MLLNRCVSSLSGLCSVHSVTLVHCGQTVEWIKTKLGMVGLGPGYIVRWAPSPPPPKEGGLGAMTFGPCLLWPNGWMDQDATWYGGRHRPRPHCVRWGPSSPGPKMGHSSSSLFRPCLAAKRPEGSRCHLVWR